MGDEERTSRNRRLWKTRLRRAAVEAATSRTGMGGDGSPSRNRRPGERYKFAQDAIDEYKAREAVTAILGKTVDFQRKKKAKAPLAHRGRVCRMMVLDWRLRGTGGGGVLAGGKQREFCKARLASMASFLDGLDTRASPRHCPSWRRLDDQPEWLKGALEVDAAAEGMRARRPLGAEGPTGGEATRRVGMRALRGRRRDERAEAARRWRRGGMRARRHGLEKIDTRHGLEKIGALEKIRTTRRFTRIAVLIAG
ncbi:hypothetical protein E2562_031979 [Oryza meyeriana var. granulata]|uniref:Uncharacterized protein n=1 Tax=Oryza meyeriana var. granulata TaxID=110450 RepID=A0A6G1F0F2_9ORYZ|nr:hypothetical protein E2562_031979 [Oryza meyeriana var. granulata]